MGQTHFLYSDKKIKNKWGTCDKALSSSLQRSPREETAGCCGCLKELCVWKEEGMKPLTFSVRYPLHQREWFVSFPPCCCSCINAGKNSPSCTSCCCTPNIYSPRSPPSPSLNTNYFSKHVWLNQLITIAGFHAAIPPSINIFTQLKILQAVHSMM